MSAVLPHETCMNRQIEVARHIVERAVYVVERPQWGEFAQHLLITFGDGFSEFEEGPHVICAPGRAAEPGELVRVYVGFRDGIGSAVEVDLLAIGLRPFLESRRDLILKKDAEGFKICRRDPS